MLQTFCTDSYSSQRYMHQVVLYTAIFLGVLCADRPSFGLGSWSHVGQLKSKLGKTVTVEILIEMLNDKENPLRELAVRALGEFGPDAKPAIPALILDLNDANSKTRELAVSALYAIGPAAKPAIPSLIDALKEPELRTIAARALGAIGPDSKQAVGQLSGIVEQTDISTDHGYLLVWAAVDALGDIGPGAMAATRALVRVLTTTESMPEIQEAAARALGKIRDDRKLAVPALSDIADVHVVPFGQNRDGVRSKDRDRARIAAALALWKINREPRVISRLIDAANDSRFAHREEAIAALGEIGPDAAAALPMLVSLAQSWRLEIDYGYGVAIIPAIGKIGPAAKDALPMLIQQLADDKWEVLSIQAALALGDVGESAFSAIPALGKMLQSSNKNERLAAAVAIRRIGGDTIITVPVLTDLLSVRRDLFVWGEFWGIRRASQLRREAATALGELGPAAKTAVPALKALLTDEFVTVREAAEQALRQIEAMPTP